MNRVLVTGATGFIGRRLVERLAQQDLQVRVLVRDPDRVPRRLRAKLDIVQGELGDAQAADRAVRGVDHVLHLAALASACARDRGVYRNLNADAVALLLDAAAGHGVRRFVHVSSIAAVPPAEPPRVRGFGHVGVTDYAASKVTAEAIVRRYVAAGHDAVIVRPSRVYGPGPWNDANGATRLAVMYLRGRLRLIPADGGVQANWVHVDDVADGIERAARRGRAGAAYELGGENASLAEFLACLSELAGVRRRVVSVPASVILPAAYAGKVWGRLGGDTSLTPEWLAFFLEHRPVCCDAARAEIGYAPRSLRVGLSQTLDWIRRQRKKPWHVPIRKCA